ncbi:MAG: hypothetical protein LCH81_08490 [Bacteroidetes bacterium]|nr:hypothetical protein [Bacteroidota bacterium]
MKKQLIATLVGGVLLFFWQFLSWSLLNVHGAEFTYTPNEGKILEALAQNLPASGQYMVPTLPPNATPEQQEAMMKDMGSKPWATISYHTSFNTNMGMNMTRGLLVDFVCVFLLIWLLLKFQNLNFQTTLLSSLAVGIIGYLTISYTNTIWFETSSIGYLVDAVVGWGLVGAWLGWWLNKK